MAQERVSLPDLLCSLYAYHIRLENRFEAEVEREIKWRALDSAISSGVPIAMIEPRTRLPDRAVARYARIRDAAIRDAKLNPCVSAKRLRVNPMLRLEYDDKRVRLARAELHEPMRVLVRKRHDAAGRPVERSNAWKLAVRWITQRLDDGFQDSCSDRVRGAARGSGVSLVEYYLDLYCRLELVPRVEKHGQFKQLAFAHDPIRRRALEGFEDALLARGYDIVGEHHKLWEKRQDDATYCKLEKTITRFDEHGKGVELLREVWGLHRAEALDVPLMPPPALPLRSPTGNDATSIEKHRDTELPKERGAMVAGDRRWLDRIVDCVHEDTRDARKLERYRAMVRDWTEGMVRNARPGVIPAREKLMCDHPNWTEEDLLRELRMYSFVSSKGIVCRGEDALDVLPDPLVVTTHAGTPLNKKYATLAAIHDDSDHCAHPINPWHGQEFDWARMWTKCGDGSPGPESVPPDEYREAAMALTYAHLKGVAVAELTDDDRAGIERMLDDVAEHVQRSTEVPTVVTGSVAEVAPGGSSPLRSDESANNATPIKRPPDDALAAWRLRDLTGVKTQREIADAMTTQLKRKVHQGEVSRWLAHIDAYLKAGNILPELPRIRKEPQSIDPQMIDMGERQDQRTQRQRQRRDPDAA